MALETTRVTATLKENPNVNTTLKSKSHLGVSAVGGINDVEARVLGIPGQQGESGVVWKGEYDSLTEYKQNDAVYYDGSSFIYINETPTIGSIPADNEFWDYLAKQSESFAWAGTYDYDASYVLNDVVYFNEATYIYVNAIEGVVEIPSGNTTTWNLFAGLPKMRKEIDEIPNGDFYVGEALPDALTSDLTWRIQFVQFIGEDISITWANQTSEFDKSWDLRDTYSY